MPKLIFCSAFITAIFKGDATQKLKTPNIWRTYPWFQRFRCANEPGHRWLNEQEQAFRRCPTHETGDSHEVTHTHGSLWSETAASMTLCLWYQLRWTLNTKKAHRKDVIKQNLKGNNGSLSHIVSHLHFHKASGQSNLPPRPHCYGNYPRASESTVKSYVKLVRVCVCVCVCVCACMTLLPSQTMH